MLFLRLLTSGLRPYSEAEARALEHLCVHPQGRRDVPEAGGGGEWHPLVWPIAAVHEDLLREGVQGGELNHIR